ncbi:substrate-binding domain-containing protein [Marispirochaeta sp.]|uniref:substrate-binding domain-containing protein n=1 Tax=Marispirochaeta sp. TaxID=2038653 RepID=UPI0029C5FFEB|nr:substrate-binding domain-containing protein [Marispirochaeta sp.]
MKRFRKYSYAILLAGLICIVISCGNKRGNAEGKDRNDDSITIGFSLATDTFILERWNKDIKIFSGTANDFGAEVLMQMSAGGTKAQIDQIRYLLEQDIDILVVLAHDTSTLAGVIKQFNDRRIPVLAYDRLVQGVPITAYISFDNQEVGRLLGDALTSKVPRGNYLIVNGSVRDNNSYEVNKGLHEILDPRIKTGDIKVVDELWLEQWSGDEAYVRIREVLDRTTDIDAISAANDQIANAAIQALSELRLAGKVQVVGQDADLLSCQRVFEGLQLMTVYKPIEKLASRAAMIAVDTVNGEMPEPERYIENGSGTPIPYFVEKPIAVFKENLEATVIRDGFHSAEDVYRNRPRDN